ncbi:MAG TPA: isoprenoid biosynthesis glyoxalase ElbB [Kiritimatiellia bacterium]|nr:isoprenoid biosynthesis glyoxalase ElbB [Kiritimatiellia bacterium]
MKKKVGVILAGCGYLDGAEIHEAVLSLLYLDEAGVDTVCMAPDIPQRKVVNHLTGEETGETRNVLVESARIARGKIRDIATVNPSELSALVLPGGFGAALNLCDFAVNGPGMSVDPGVARMVESIHKAGKPIGAICISPAIIAKLIPGVKLTIGSDQGTASALQALSAVHESCVVGGVVIDGNNNVVTTPAYMLGPWVKDVASGIKACIQEVLKRVG